MYPVLNVAVVHDAGLTGDGVADQQLQAGEAPAESEPVQRAGNVHPTLALVIRIYVIVALGIVKLLGAAPNYHVIVSLLSVVDSRVLHRKLGGVGLRQDIPDQ